MKLIDKQKALNALMAERKYLIARGQESAEHVLTHHAYNIIDEQPIIESRPKGKWIEIMYTEDRTGMKCSECGYRYGGIFGSNYCPHCGSYMKGEQK